MLITIQTSEGTIKADLDEAKAPVTVKNFMSYVDDGHYDGTIFHRVIPSFMIQGGGFSADMKQKPTKSPIRNEAGNGLTNDRGTLAMARTSVVDSATSQFFINTANNAFLNHRGETPDAFGYAVFGKVVEGMNVVERIEKVRTGRAGPHGDVPVKPVVIESIRASQGQKQQA
jgi:cyclophilin family peptidyl-prolyl cis-trans isomerase